MLDTIHTMYNSNSRKELPLPGPYYIKIYIHRTSGQYPKFSVKKGKNTPFLAQADKLTASKAGVYYTLR